MKLIAEKITQLIKYTLRDELDIRRKLLNVLLLVILVIQIPATIMTLMISQDPSGFWTMLLIFLIVAFCFWDLNKHPKSVRPLLIVAAGVTLGVFPFMYYTCGGHRSGMMIWMVMGLICVMILLEGPLCAVVVALDIAVMVAMPLLEEKYPDWVIPMGSEHSEIIDQIVAMLAVGLTFGIMFKYQGNMYEKQTKKLEEQDKELRDANIRMNRTNKELEHANKDFERANQELVEAKAELEEANHGLNMASEAKSSFLANMSHEIRTPINAVLGMDEMILRESHDENILKYAMDIDSAGNQLLALINDILDFSKIESGKMEIHPAEYEMFSIINDCYNMINIRAKKKSLEFKIINDPLLPAFLIGDEVRVRQIIMNLLTNAVKYTREGSATLYVAFRKIDDENIMLHIEVSDTGIGISPENQTRLFSSFQRFDEVRNRNIEGTGLGLSITKKFIDIMGGTVSLKSTPDVGSTFIVDIPQKIASQNQMGDFSERFNKRRSVAEEKRNVFTAPDARILVVDDVKMNLNVVRLLLKNTKVQVDMAASGKESLQMTMMKKYDLILMDHMMPEMDGIEAFHEISKQKMGLNQDTPVIALTANALVGAEEMYKAEGFVDYLSKPIRGESLERTLIKYISMEKIRFNEEQTESAKY